MEEKLSFHVCYIPTLCLDGRCKDCRYYSDCDLDLKGKYVAQYRKQASPVKKKKRK